MCGVATFYCGIIDGMSEHSRPMKTSVSQTPVYTHCKIELKCFCWSKHINYWHNKMDRAIGSKGYIGILNSLRTRHTDYGVVKLVSTKHIFLRFQAQNGWCGSPPFQHRFVKTFLIQSFCTMAFHCKQIFGWILKVFPPFTEFLGSLYLLQCSVFEEPMFRY